MHIEAPRIVHAGEHVTGSVTTSSNVASVELRLAGYSMTMRKIGVGAFATTYVIPDIPVFLKRTYDLQVIARNVDGTQDTQSIPIDIR